MKLLFQKSFDALMYRFEVRLLIDERLGPDLTDIIMQFLREDPEPVLWNVQPEPSPWDALTEVDPCAAIGLPIFSP